MPFFLFLFLYSTASIRKDDTPDPTPSPETPSQAPSATIVWVTCITGTVIIGLSVLFLCVKKQPDDLLFEKSRDHLNAIASLNTLHSVNETENITTQLMYTPEGSLN